MQCYTKSACVCVNQDHGRLWKSLLTRRATNRSLTDEGMSVVECSTWESSFRILKPIPSPFLSHFVTIFSRSSQSRSAFVDRGNRRLSTSTVRPRHAFLLKRSEIFVCDGKCISTLSLPHAMATFCGRLAIHLALMAASRASDA